MILKRFWGTLALAVFLGTSSSLWAVPVYWDPSAGGNGHTYEGIIASDVITWEAASAGAEAIGPGWHLVTITSGEENTFVEGLFSGDSAYFHDHGYYVASGPWIGAFATTEVSGDWAWVTGEPFSFTDWGPLEPASNGNRISYASFGDTIIGWNDVSSGHFLSPWSYIAEYDGQVGPSIPAPGALLLGTVGAGMMGWLRRRKTF